MSDDNRFKKAVEYFDGNATDYIVVAPLDHGHVGVMIRGSDAIPEISSPTLW